MGGERPRGSSPWSPCLGLAPGKRPYRVRMGVARETPSARTLSAFATCQEGVHCFPHRNGAQRPSPVIVTPETRKGLWFFAWSWPWPDALPPCPPGGTDPFQVNWCLPHSSLMGTTAQEGGAGQWVFSVQASHVSGQPAFSD